MLDLEGATLVAEAASAFRFVNPCAGKSVSDLSPDLPLFIVRAGRDEVPHVNDSIDRFVSAALSANLPLTLVNHHTAPYAFDIAHDSDATREIVEEILAFLRHHLEAA